MYRSAPYDVAAAAMGAPATGLLCDNLASTSSSSAHHDQQSTCGPPHHSFPARQQLSVTQSQFPLAGPPFDASTSGGGPTNGVAPYGGSNPYRSGLGISGSTGAPSGGSDDSTEAYISRTLYICKLPPDFTEGQIHEVLVPYGDIRKITCYPSRQIAFAEFWDIRDAQKARTALKDVQIGGRQVEIQYSKTRDDKSKERNTGTLYVRPVTTERNFHDPNTLQQYKELFNRYGEVKKVNTNRKREAEKFIEYHDLRAAQRALEGLNGLEFNGVKLEVQFANQSSKTINKEGSVGGSSGEYGIYHPYGRHGRRDVAPLSSSGYGGPPRSGSRPTLVSSNNAPPYLRRISLGPAGETSGALPPGSTQSASSSFRNSPLASGPAGSSSDSASTPQLGSSGSGPGGALNSRHLPWGTPLALRWNGTEGPRSVLAKLCGAGREDPTAPSTAPSVYGDHADTPSEGMVNKGFPYGAVSGDTSQFHEGQGTGNPTFLPCVRPPPRVTRIRQPASSGHPPVPSSGDMGGPRQQLQPTLLQCRSPAVKVPPGSHTSAQRL